MQNIDSPAEQPALKYLFHPGSIAITGLSNDPTGKLSVERVYMESLIEKVYVGKIYPINPNGSEILGLRIYPTVKDIPDRFDYVMAAISAPYLPQLIVDSAAKGAKKGAEAVHIFSAGHGTTEIGAKTTISHTRARRWFRQSMEQPYPDNSCSIAFSMPSDSSFDLAQLPQLSS